MLYVSTRNNTNRFSPQETLQTDCAPDGGAFVPEVIPSFAKDKIFALKEQTFTETVASILNLFFETNLNAWDIEFCIGRYPYKFRSMHHKILVAEIWNNLESTYTYFESGIFGKLTESFCKKTQPTRWAKVAIQIAVFCGLFGEMMRRGIYEADVSVSADDFISPVAAWYVRMMGIPVKNIICAASNNRMFWDFIHRGECSTGFLTDNKNLIAGIETMLLGAYGYQENHRFVDCIEKRSVYALPENNKTPFVKGCFVSVPGDDRVDDTIRSIFQIHDYLASPMTAQLFSGLQDFRARTGESRSALLLSLSSPGFHIGRLSRAIGYSAQEIDALIKKA